MTRNKIRDQVLFFTCFLRVFLEHRFKSIVSPDTRLHHFGERALFCVFRRDLQVTTDMFCHQFLNVLRRLNRKVITQTRCNQDLFDPLHFTRFSVKGNQWGLVSIQILANRGIDT